MNHYKITKIMYAILAIAANPALSKFPMQIQLTHNPLQIPARYNANFLVGNMA